MVKGQASSRLSVVSAGFSVLVAVLLTSWQASACHITFEPELAKAGPDGIASFTAVVKWEHRKCVLDDDDINVDAEGVEILEQSKWRKVKRGLFKSDFKVKLTGEKGKVRVWRECSKKGVSEGFIEITK
ncbi:MAG: hypothetical protein GXP49_08790 [Deltaproteobacteria bacterium]|nr:hypothetical protein [Deltaproteobacteria bacterium]